MVKPRSACISLLGLFLSMVSVKAAEPLPPNCANCQPIPMPAHVAPAIATLERALDTEGIRSAFAASPSCLGVTGWSTEAPTASVEICHLASACASVTIISPPQQPPLIIRFLGYISRARGCDETGLQSPERAFAHAFVNCRNPAATAAAIDVLLTHPIDVSTPEKMEAFNRNPPVKDRYLSSYYDIREVCGTMFGSRWIAASGDGVKEEMSLQTSPP